MERNVEEFAVSKSYEHALRVLRRAIKAEGLVIAAELPISEMLRSQLGVGLGRCAVLLVHCPFLLLEAMVMDSASMSLLPVHVCVSDRGGGAVIRIASPGLFDLPVTGTIDPIRKTFERSRRSVRAAAAPMKPTSVPATALAEGERLTG